MIELVKEKYKDYLYIEGMPEDKSNVAFYVKHGFQEFEGAGSIIICNPDKGNSLKPHIYINWFESQGQISDSSC